MSFGASDVRYGLFFFFFFFFFESKHPPSVTVLSSSADLTEVDIDEAWLTFSYSVEDTGGTESDPEDVLVAGHMSSANADGTGLTTLTFSRFQANQNHEITLNWVLMRSLKCDLWQVKHRFVDDALATSEIHTEYIDSVLLASTDRWGFMNHGTWPDVETGTYSDGPDVGFGNRPQIGSNTGFNSACSYFPFDTNGVARFFSLFFFFFFFLSHASACSFVAANLIMEVDANAQIDPVFRLVCDFGGGYTAGSSVAGNWGQILEANSIVDPVDINAANFPAGETVVLPIKSGSLGGIDVSGTTTIRCCVADDQQNDPNGLTYVRLDHDATQLQLISSFGDNTHVLPTLSSHGQSGWWNCDDYVSCKVTPTSAPPTAWESAYRENPWTQARDLALQAILFPGSQAQVVSGTDSIATGSASLVLTGITAISDVSRALLFWTAKMDTVEADNDGDEAEQNFDNDFFHGQVTDVGEITFTRATTGGGYEFEWYVVVFADGTSVTTETLTFGVNDPQICQTMSGGKDASSDPLVPFVSGRYGSTGVITVFRRAEQAFARASFAGTSVCLDRSTIGTATTMKVQVVDFSGNLCGTPTSSPSSASPTSSPTSQSPTASPSSVNPTSSPTSQSPTASPSSVNPTGSPTSQSPTASPSSVNPTSSPTSQSPTASPSSANPTGSPTSQSPTASPSSANPTSSPTSQSPTASPSSANPTGTPTSQTPTASPSSANPTGTPTSQTPTASPSSVNPTGSPTSQSPTASPSSANPTGTPTSQSPTASPSSVGPTIAPTSQSPTASPSSASPTDSPNVAISYSESIFAISDIESNVAISYSESIFAISDIESNVAISYSESIFAISDIESNVAISYSESIFPISDIESNVAISYSESIFPTDFESNQQQSDRRTFFSVSNCEWCYWFSHIAGAFCFTDAESNSSSFVTIANIRSDVSSSVCCTE